MSHPHPDAARSSGRDFGRAFAVAIVLNLAYVAVETGIGLAVGSMGLLADAGHNATDVLSLVIAWGAAAMARRPPSDRYTYGLRRSTVLASLFNALLLFGAMGAVAWNALERLADPVPVPGGTVVWVAAIGLGVNFGTALLFIRGQDDLNVRGAYLHMLADGLVTLGVLVAGVAISLTDLAWIDPATSLAIVAVVLWSTWGMFRDALRLSLDAAPERIDVEAVRTWLAAQPGVEDVHDLHVWAMSTTETALTVHLVVASDDAITSELIVRAQEGLTAHFDIHHTTIQVEGPEVATAGAETPCC